VMPVLSDLMDPIRGFISKGSSLGRGSEWIRCGKAGGLGLDSLGGFRMTGADPAGMGDPK
jgi:hypothetical protein